MDSRSQYFSKLTVALLLMMFVFALGNIIYNLENLNLGAEAVPEFVEGSAQQSGITSTSTTLANMLRWVYFGFLGFLVLTLIIGAYSFTKSKDQKKWKNLFYQMAGYLVIVAVILAFGVFYDDIENTMTQSGDTNVVIGGGSGNVSAENITAVPDGPDAAKIISTLGLWAFMFSFWALIFIAIVKLAKERSTKIDYSDLDLQTQEVADTIQRTIDALAQGSDTRATVIRCYTDMCKVMAKHGVLEEEHLTPREFEELARDNLPVPDDMIHELVMVFEEARYSDHQLTPEDSNRALTALEEVKAKLLEAMPREEEDEQ